MCGPIFLRLPEREDWGGGGEGARGLERTGKGEVGGGGEGGGGRGEL